VKLNYTDQGAGEAVILLHGIFGYLSNLGNLARELSSAYRVISVDLRNHGNSPHHPQMDIPTLANDIVELIDDLGLSAAILIGYSLGGKVAMQVALNYPSSVTKVVIADIAPVTYIPRKDPALEALLTISGIDVTSLEQADSVMAEHLLTPEFRSLLLKNLIRKASGTYILKINMSSISENYPTLAVAPAGRPYSGPTLFLKGENSAYIQSKHHSIMLALFPNMKLEVINDVGHFLHSENPVEFNRHVTDFLA
jgi:esterase